MAQQRYSSASGSFIRAAEHPSARLAPALERLVSHTAVRTQGAGGIAGSFWALLPFLPCGHSSGSAWALRSSAPAFYGSTLPIWGSTPAICDSDRAIYDSARTIYGSARALCGSARTICGSAWAICGSARALCGSTW
jgi:hypothetical protein